MTSAVVVVPAHDEEESVVATMLSVRHALERARAEGLVDRCVLEVVAHRCRDRTGAVAREVRTDDEHVTDDETSTTVGQVRDRGARRGLARLGGPPASTWVLSTDADTQVQPTWVVDVLQHAEAAGAVGVVGLAALDGWHGSEDERTSYERLLAAKMRAPHGVHQHDHVYAANLAVRADAYLDVGGFPHVTTGEDQALVEALASRGHRLLRTSAIEVRTSARLRGRAPGGLADTLAALTG